ncbi:MAG TPA: histidine phosphatase family protein [Candidatus Saccharimonadia bacterium]|jgi:broad specificity phosphatase PhoE
MAMPINLVFVRHGQSEGNVASKASRQGDLSLFTPEYKKRLGWQYRLSTKGVTQAESAGEWLNANQLGYFDRRYVSDHIRALETASLLGTQGPPWYREVRLREREWGDLDTLSHEERLTRYRDSMERKQTDPFSWIPPNGESMAQLTLRLDRLFGTLDRECSSMNVLVVCHGEVMWGYRYLIERMTLERYAQLDASTVPHDRIHNCQIIQYTRRDPWTHELSGRLDWMRSVCPWQPNLSPNEWTRIDRARYTEADLRAIVDKYPRLPGF